jgi:hypothetical protein
LSGNPGAILLRRLTTRTYILYGCVNLRICMSQNSALGPIGSLRQAGLNQRQLIESISEVDKIRVVDDFSENEGILLGGHITPIGVTLNSIMMYGPRSSTF